MSDDEAQPAKNGFWSDGHKWIAAVAAQRDLDAPEMFPPDTAARLRAALSSGPVEMVSLTPPATHAVRARTVDAGRYAPLVGELSEVGPQPPLLGMIVDQYTPETAATEIAGWLETTESGSTACHSCWTEFGPARSMAEQFIHLLEVACPDAVVDALAEMSADEARAGGGAADLRSS